MQHKYYFHTFIGCERNSMKDVKNAKIISTETALYWVELRDVNLNSYPVFWNGGLSVDLRTTGVFGILINLFEYEAIFPPSIRFPSITSTTRYSILDYQSAAATAHNATRFFNKRTCGQRTPKVLVWMTAARCGCQIRFTCLLSFFPFEELLGLFAASSTSQQQFFSQYQ